MKTMSKTVKLPTKRGDWRLMGRTARLILTIPRYVVLWIVLSLFAISIFVISQNWTAFTGLVVGGNLPISNRFNFLINLYPPLSPSYTILSGATLWGVALLVGLNLTMLIYHFREHGLKVSKGSGGLIGVILATLGAGCAACGSAILVAILSVFGVTSITFLPLEGLEFALISVIPLILSIYWIAQGMRGGEINGCPVDL